MGSSLLLKGGTNTPKSIVETIAVAHSFAVGDVVRYDQSTFAWTKSQANTAENSEVAGVVSAVNSTTSFDVTYSGFINITSLAGVTSPVLFLDSSAAGGLTASPPSAIGSVVKPVLTKTSNGSGYVVSNYLGTQIGGSSTVAIDEIQPVGTIMPFAGSTIPDSWLACDGNSYAIGTYPNLYAKLQNSSGDRVPAYGYVATLTGTNVSSVLSAGDYIQYKTDSGTWTGTGSPFAGAASNAALLATVLSVTSTTAVVQVIPIYSSTTKNFTINNTVFGSGGFVGSETGTGNYRAYTTASAFKAVSLTITGVAITHFNTPDLRGRFAIGSNTSTLPATGDLEGDSANNSAISGIYSIGSEGGEELHTLTTAEIPAHDHNLKSLINAVSTGSLNIIGADNHNTNFNGTVSTTLNGSDGRPPHTATTGSNTAHNNMPPYTVVRYIIKASPYSRAAIIDGIDIPYTSLLVGDLRPFTLRGAGSGEDLVFKTNDGASGVERMRLTNTPSAAAPGGLVIGDTSHTSGGAGPFTTAYRLLEVATTSGVGGGVFVARSPSTILEMGANEGLGSALVGTRTNHPLVFRTNTVERLRIDSSRTTLTHASSNFGAANSGHLVVGEGVASGDKQLQFGVSDTHECAWIEGWVNSLGGLTLSLQPTGGRVGIGTVNPSSTLQVNGTLSVSVSGAYPTASSSRAYNRVLFGGTGASLLVWDDGSAVAATNYASVGIGAKSGANPLMLAGGYIRGGLENITDSSGYLLFNTTPADGSSNVERMRITSTGLVDVQGSIRAKNGIRFGTDTAAANTLSDYEEGSYTATVTYSTTLSSTSPATTTTITARYVKVGKLVTVFTPQITRDGTFSGTNVIINTISLPFASANYGEIGTVGGYRVRGQYSTSIAQYGEYMFATASNSIAILRMLSNTALGDAYYPMLDRTNSAVQMTMTYCSAT
jgi:microcystin-dependent protein